MDKNNFFEKAKVSAEILSARTGVTAAKAADAAGKTAASVLSATKLNLQIFDLNTEVEILYKEIGKMVHSEHLGKEEDPAVLQIKLQLIDENSFTRNAARYFARTAASSARKTMHFAAIAAHNYKAHTITFASNVA